MVFMCVHYQLYSWWRPTLWMQSRIFPNPDPDMVPETISSSNLGTVFCQAKLIKLSCVVSWPGHHHSLKAPSCLANFLSAVLKLCSLTLAPSLLPCLKNLWELTRLTSVPSHSGNGAAHVLLSFQYSFYRNGTCLYTKLNVHQSMPGVSSCKQRKALRVQCSHFYRQGISVGETWMRRTPKTTCCNVISSRQGYQIRLM